MSAPTANETWIIEAGDAVIQKRAHGGIHGLSVMERLIYCLWVADYRMRNAGDLETARDVYADFQTEAVQLARALGLQATEGAFLLPTAELQREYFNHFNSICAEIQRTQGMRLT